MKFNAPLSNARAERLIDGLAPPAGGRVIDVGCGQGELLMMIAARCAASGVGIDNDPKVLSGATENASQRGLSDSIQFQLGDAKEIESADNVYDCGICVGATHAYAAGEPAYQETLRNLSRIVRPGGKLLIGEGYWRQSPARAYLEVIGEPVGIYRNHYQNVALGEQLGLSPILAVTANCDEWDEFEWGHQNRMLREAESESEEKRAQRIEHIRKWRNAYLRWGRQTMGFGFYLFANPTAS